MIVTDKTMKLGNYY